MSVHSYDEKDDLKHDAGEVTAHVGAAEESTKHREDVDRAGPHTDEAGSCGILLMEHPSNENNQVHGHPIEC